MLWIRIRDPVPFWPLDPGSVMGKKSGSESGMNNPDPISESLETSFFELKYLNYLMQIRDLGWKKFDRDPGWKKFDPGSGMGKIRIRDKQSGSATLLH